MRDEAHERLMFHVTTVLLALLFHLVLVSTDRSSRELPRACEILVLFQVELIGAQASFHRAKR